MLIDDELERKKIKDKYFNKKTFEDTSPFVDKSMWQLEYYHALANYLIDKDADDEFLLSTLDFINKSLEPLLYHRLLIVWLLKERQNSFKEKVFFN